MENITLTFAKISQKKENLQVSYDGFYIGTIEKYKNEYIFNSEVPIFVFGAKSESLEEVKQIITDYFSKIVKLSNEVINKNIEQLKKIIEHQYNVLTHTNECLESEKTEIQRLKTQLIEKEKIKNLYIDKYQCEKAMEKPCYLVHTADAWQSKDSYILLFATTNIEKVKKFFNAQKNNHDTKMILSQHNEDNKKDLVIYDSYAKSYDKNDIE